MKKSISILAVLTVSAISSMAGSTAMPACSPATPEPESGSISYNSVELLYAYTDFDASGAFRGGKESGDGLRLNFEYSPVAHLFFTASAGANSVEDFDLWSVSAGVGGFVHLTKHIDLAADAGFIYTRLDRDDADGYYSAKGYYVRPHLRAKLGRMEAHVGAEWSDRHNDGGDISLFAKLYYQVAPGWDATLGFVDDESATTVLSGGISVVAGVRFRF